MFGEFDCADVITFAEFVAADDNGLLGDCIIFCIDTVDVVFENGEAWVRVEQLGFHEKAAKQGQYHYEQNGTPDGGQVEGENSQQCHEKRDELGIDILDGDYGDRETVEGILTLVVEFEMEAKRKYCQNDAEKCHDVSCVQLARPKVNVMRIFFIVFICKFTYFVWSSIRSKPFMSIFFYIIIGHFYCFEGYDRGCVEGQPLSAPRLVISSRV